MCRDGAADLLLYLDVEVGATPFILDYTSMCRVGAADLLLYRAVHLYTTIPGWSGSEQLHLYLTIPQCARLEQLIYSYT
jgi:hypothetical protein